MKRKCFLAGGILLLLVLGAGVWLYQLSVPDSDATQLKLTGNVDVREVAVAFRRSDRIARLLVDAGDQVQEGDLLAKLDTQSLELELEKAQAEERAQESALEKAENGVRPEERTRLVAQVKSAQAAADYAQSVFARRQELYAVDGVSRQDLEGAQADRDAKAAALQEAKAALLEAENGTRAEDLSEARAKLEASQKEVARLAYEISQCELRAPASGVIRARLLEAGDMASASNPVFKLSPMGKKWVRVYVKETDLPRIYEGQQASIHIDSLPEPLTGQVGYISETAEFTPKNVQTEELRTALVYEVRVYVEDRDNVLRLGMPATVTIDV